MNQQKIYEDINEFYNSIISKKDGGDLERFFSFLKKNPHQAPFNNALVFAQRPNCVYYMTSYQWEKIHGQKIRPGVSPMVILFPFGPVRFVYDYEDTEGPFTLSKNGSLNWWKEIPDNDINISIYKRTEAYLEKFYHIVLSYKTGGEYLRYHSLSTAGYAKWNNLGEKFEITLHPRYTPISTDNVTEAYGVLVHEIAHILLGHLGPKYYYESRGMDKTKRLYCEDRTWLSDSVKELEAELIAWLVFNRFGNNKNSSVDYMASWLKKDNDWQMINLSNVLRTANTIFEMRV
jgi:hypothetical protein